MLECVANFHVNEGKLVPRANKGYLVGYPNGVKGFRIWCLDDRKCIIGRDVNFQEIELYQSITSSIDQANYQKDCDRFELKVEHTDKSTTQANKVQNATTEPTDETYVIEADNTNDDYQLAIYRKKTNKIVSKVCLCIHG